MACRTRFRIFRCSKIVCDWGFGPGATGGVYSAPPDPLATLEEGREE